MSEQSTHLNQAWQELLPPVPPEPVSLWLVYGSGFLLLLVIIVVYVLWRQRPRQRALRQLQRCAKQLQQTQPDLKQIMRMVYSTVLNGLGLNPTTALSESHQQDPFWALFYLRLQQSVFGATTPSRDEVASLLNQSDYWLRRFPR